MQQDDQALKRDVALAYQILYMEAIARDDTLGHVSARAPGDGVVHIKPWGMGFEEVTPDRLVSMDLDGANLTPDKGRLHSEVPIHNEIYKARDDVNCVIHIHPHHAILLSSVWKGRLYIVNQHTQQFVRGIGLYDSSELVRRDDQGRALAAALGTANVVLLKNHGVVAVGSTVQEALVLSVLLERAAETHLALLPFGDAVDEIPTEVAEHWADELSQQKHYANKFDYWCRKLAREGTGAYTG